MAIASLISGILFLILPAAILAILFGHLSRSRIKRSAGHLKGQGMALAGLILGYFGIALIPLLILAAILFPYLLRARIAASKASAVGSLGSLNVATARYATEYNQGYPATLSALGPPQGGATPGADAAGLVDEALASGRKNGYDFIYSVGEKDANGRPSTYTINANPVVPGTRGQNYYFTDQSGVIRKEKDRVANEQSPPLALKLM
jgi:type II secretory pathway pseudopilin PulG